jgi:multidrug efflux pump subunit AcrA (membrane-fusion protein)
VDKRALIVFILIGVLSISAAGYFGFSTTQEPEPTPAPQTIAVTTCDVEQSVAAPGVLDNTSETQILMPVNGNLSQVFVRVGDSVAAGQILATVDDISRAEAWTALKEAKDAYQSAFNYRKSLEGLIWLDRITYGTKDGQRTPVHHRYKGYADPETIGTADNNLALKKAELDAAQAALDNTELKAPFSGVVIDVAAVEGLPKKTGDLLFKIIDPKALEAEANITEEDFPLVSLDQEVELFFDARSDVTVTGRVDRIIPIRIEGDSPRYHIYITLSDVPDGLADGMTVDAAITITKRENVLCLPRSIVRASGVNEVMLKVWVNGAVETRQAVVGLRGDSDVEILSGLQEGDQVVIQ